MDRIEPESVDRIPDARAFVEDASRALRDPLTVCVGYLEGLSDDAYEQRRTVGIVVEELCRMVRIVNDLEVLVAAESPDFLHPETIDVETFTQELVEGATDLGPRGWVVDAIGEGPLVADRSRLTEAVMDLADNALHHTRADQTIAIGSSSDEQETRLWVRDTGRGIEEADRERIFEIFARGDDAHRRYRGGGLGLAVVRAVADAHRGHVEVESRPGGGSTFTIVLPRSPSAGGVG